MAKVKAYYDKELQVPIVSEPSFYAYPIEIEENVLAQCDSLRGLLDAIIATRRSTAFPSGAQAAADLLADDVAAIMKTQKRRPKNVSQ